MKVLLFEDDRQTASFVLKGLREAGMVADHAADGKGGLFMALNNTYDALIVDRLLPELDGLSLVKSLRAAGNKTPLMFLTALSDLDDKVDGLTAGGDDYLVKPFAHAELVARLLALCRRPPLVNQQTLLREHDLEMDLLARQVKRQDKVIELQPQEFKLLEYLLRHAGQVVTRTMLLENVWDFHFEPNTSVVETHISRLRGKIDKGYGHDLIQTVRGAGYRLQSPHSAD